MKNLLIIFATVFGLALEASRTQPNPPPAQGAIVPKSVSIAELLAMTPDQMHELHYDNSVAEYTAKINAEAALSATLPRPPTKAEIKALATKLGRQPTKAEIAALPVKFGRQPTPAELKPYDALLARNEYNNHKLYASQLEQAAKAAKNPAQKKALEEMAVHEKKNTESYAKNLATLEKQIPNAKQAMAAAEQISKKAPQALKPNTTGRKAYEASLAHSKVAASPASKAGKKEAAAPSVVKAGEAQKAVTATTKPTATSSGKTGAPAVSVPGKTGGTVLKTGAQPKPPVAHAAEVHHAAPLAGAPPKASAVRAPEVHHQTHSPAPPKSHAPAHNPPPKPQHNPAPKPVHHQAY